MAEQLTPEQRMAVEDRGGKLLVSAAAGSGKTKVLVDRLMGYILDPAAPANIDDFLIITYTKAAAAELRGKIAAKLSEHLAEFPEHRHLQRQMQRLYLAKISTVHSFCTELLREYAYALDLAGDFRVADENECTQLRLQAMEEVLERAYAQGMENGDFRAFVDTQGLGRNDRFVPEIVMKVYDSARCHLNPEVWLDRCLEGADLADITDAAQTPWGKYLIRDLKEYLAMQITAMNECARLAKEAGNMEKPAELLEQAVRFLEHLAQAETWDQVVERRRINYGNLRFGKKADPELAEQIKAVRNHCKAGLEKRLKVFCDPSEQVLADLALTSQAARGLVALAREFGRQYEALKLRRRVMDFSDLEHRTLDLLVGKRRNGPTRLAREIGQRFREVLVDEYQDSNQVQDAIFSALTQEQQNCFMVGDVKQSIYQFRLADPGIFLEKYHSYVPAGTAQPKQGRKVMLSRNFRSGGAVLAAANDVFFRCMTQKVGGLDYGEAEALREGIPHEALGEPEVELHVLQTGEDAYGQEAAFVAQRIAQLLDGQHRIRGKDGLRPIEPEDIAILLRSPGSVGQTYQDALALRGIRSSFGSGRDLLKTGEISLVHSLLQVISNPMQDIPLLAVLASPVFGFTADDLARIRGRNRKCGLYEALCLDESEQSRGFQQTLEQLRQVSRTATLAQLLEQIFCLTKLDSIYGAMDSGVDRTANLREFYRIVMEFEAGSRRDLSQFLEHLEMLKEKGLTISPESSGGAVQILSIHKSKGLEYPVVFLCALSRGFNRENLRERVLCDGELGLGLSAVDHETRIRYPTIAKRAIVARATGESLSEEMRVLYVAMTRARDRLIMTYSGKGVEKELADIARRMEPGGSQLMAGDADCPGLWVLMEAMCRTEAGALFALAGAKPEQTRTSEYAWRIETGEAPEAQVSGKAQAEAAPGRSLPEGTGERMREHLTFSYGHDAATQTPSKQTATQMKGRQKDEEAAEAAQPAPAHQLWRPLRGESGRGRAYGSAVHGLMQYLRFDRCATEQELEQEIQRIVQKGLVEPELAAQADRAGILAFFATELGQKMIRGETLREFKFSILEDGAKYDRNLAGEEILLQGVVDCALVEPDGITIVDFKTDYVTAQTVGQIRARYRDQVEVYAGAMERIFCKPIKGKYLYLFHLRQLVEV